jgi:hypothetical protein
MKIVLLLLFLLIVAGYGGGSGLDFNNECQLPIVYFTPIFKSETKFHFVAINGDTHETMLTSSGAVKEWRLDYNKTCLCGQRVIVLWQEETLETRVEKTPKTENVPEKMPETIKTLNTRDNKKKTSEEHSRQRKGNNPFTRLFEVFLYDRRDYYLSNRILISQDYIYFLDHDKIKNYEYTIHATVIGKTKTLGGVMMQVNGL